MFIYTESDTESHRKTHKTSTYNTKHTKNTKLHFRLSHFFKGNKRIASKIVIQKTAVFYADVYGTINIVEGHNLTNFSIFFPQHNVEVLLFFWP